MRTTLTLDADVAGRLRQAVKRRRRPFRSVVNEALRAGLQRLDEQELDRTAYRTTGFDLGASRVGCLDNIEDVLARVEGEGHR
jgi:Arc/MetJ-type ribon-helix-helix transcriptional regulator